MTREEKAKAYDEALEKAKKYHEEYWQVDAKDITETLFPQLRESEDERIRKYLIGELKTAKSVGELKFTIPQPTREECIAYLEKQKEQKPTLSDEGEKIRKEIVEHIKDQIDSFISAPDCRDKYEEEELARYKNWIAYLEKQKEATNFAELTSKLSANEQEIMFNAWPKGEWTKRDDNMIQALNNCVDELHEVYSWNYVYHDGGNFTITAVKKWIEEIGSRIKKEK